MKFLMLLSLLMSGVSHAQGYPQPIGPFEILKGRMAVCSVYDVPCVGKVLLEGMELLAKKIDGGAQPMPAPVPMRRVHFFANGNCTNSLMDVSLTGNMDIDSGVCHKKAGAIQNAYTESKMEEGGTCVSLPSFTHAEAACVGSI
jgi:hypothetical protein